MHALYSVYPICQIITHYISNMHFKGNRKILDHQFFPLYGIPTIAREWVVAICE